VPDGRGGVIGTRSFRVSGDGHRELEALRWAVDQRRQLLNQAESLLLDLPEEARAGLPDLRAGPRRLLPQQRRPDGVALCERLARSRADDGDGVNPVPRAAR
jgi:hypothetical protein